MGFHKWGIPENGWFIEEKTFKLMITRGTPIFFGKPHMDIREHLQEPP